MTAKNGNEGKHGTITAKIKYKTYEEINNSFEVPKTSFPARSGNRVTLFSDAHIGAAQALLPTVIVSPNAVSVEVTDDGKSKSDLKKIKKKEKELEKQRKKEEKERKKAEKEQNSKKIQMNLSGAPTTEYEYRLPNCWETIYKAILNAKFFIYITGWSIDHTISLLRERPIFQTDPPQEGDNGFLTIGELLAKKSKEGVKVLLLLWNEATSVAGVEREGLMCTHDERTKAFFHGSGVKVHLAFRDGSLASNNKFLWTHHQKSIILDAEALSDVNTEQDQTKRRIIAFVGGLDMCDGRWDTPEHTLYKSLQTHHKSDFHQVFPGVTQDLGPREPWHDIHSSLEGPVCRDVLRNFEQRWRKQASKHADMLLDINAHPQLISVEEEKLYPSTFWDSWTVQLFRSIDHYSANMENEERVDNSIQKAYVHHIRRANRFIYIENQYFLGSSQAWEKGKGQGIDCQHLIPLELVCRIEKAISEGKPFCVYVLVPMYPEGNPTDAAVQEILSWQFLTVQMMYARIHRALAAKNLLGTQTVEDYLNFYCMGNRETKDGSQAVGGEFNATERPYQALLEKSRRFAIYVHSKMMIVDDEYVIVGSANINERSMNGARDSEIAIGAFQPHYAGGNSRGSIHAFRLGVWAAHLRKFDSRFLHPEKPECARFVNEEARENWRLYAGDQVVNMNGQLMKYPYSVDANGKLQVIQEQIPDTTALFRGAGSLILPNILTL